MNRIGIIKQPAGLGDIFFSQKIAKTILQKNIVNQIIWPVIKEYAYISDYLINEKIEYISQESNFPYKHIYITKTKEIIKNENLLFLPLQSADSVIKDLPILQAKYKFCKMDYHDWTDYFDFKRNREREKYLENYLDVKEPYILINNNFGSKDYAHLNNNRGIFLNNNKCVYMNYFEFDNIFDWIGIIERASEIHTVDTVWCYLMTKMGIKNVTVYSRKPDPNFFKYVEGIFDPDWNYIL